MKVGEDRLVDIKDKELARRLTNAKRPAKAYKQIEISMKDHRKIMNLYELQVLKLTNKNPATFDQGNTNFNISFFI